jgi:hypothetical protein
LTSKRKKEFPLDKTRKPLGVIGMVHEDYTMFKRWYDHYASQVGPENLFVFSHGNDPHHRVIAPGANVINAPRDPSMFKFDPRRWRMMGDFASGMLNFYNWMLVTDIDELVVVDPDVATGLVPYLEDRFAVGQPVPACISPFALNIVHVPEQEPLPIDPAATVLSRRRHFYPSRMYSKPNLISKPVMFGPGGHRNNLGRRILSDDLYLVHLKMYDVTGLEERVARQVSLVDEAGETNSEMAGYHVWRTSLDAYREARDKFELGPEDIRLPEVRAKMVDDQFARYQDRYIWGDFENKTLYRIPDRFAGLV